MSQNRSVQFFDKQFRDQVAANSHALNPFETTVLPHLRGTVLDFGCGLGNLAIEAARRGCSVLALDASREAITYLRSVAIRDGLPLVADEADLRSYDLAEDFDTVICIGLLMFFDCPTALRQLEQLQLHVRPGGVAVVNVLTEGTTFMDMFAPDDHCLFKQGQLRELFADWELVSYMQQEFEAPRETRKVFVTAIARRSHACATDA